MRIWQCPRLGCSLGTGKGLVIDLGRKTRTGKGLVIDLGRKTKSRQINKRRARAQSWRGRIRQGRAEKIKRYGRKIKKAKRHNTEVARFHMVASVRQQNGWHRRMQRIEMHEIESIKGRAAKRNVGENGGSEV